MSPPRNHLFFSARTLNYHDDPTVFFHNTDDFFSDKNKASQGLYATQATLMKAKLETIQEITE